MKMRMLARQGRLAFISNSQLRPNWESVVFGRVAAGGCWVDLEFTERGRRRRKAKREDGSGSQPYKPSLGKLLAELPRHDRLRFFALFWSQMLFDEPDDLFHGGPTHEVKLEQFHDPLAWAAARAVLKQQRSNEGQVDL